MNICMWEQSMTRWWGKSCLIILPSLISLPFSEIIPYAAGNDEMQMDHLLPSFSFLPSLLSSLGRGHIMTLICPASLGAIVRRPGLYGPGRLLQWNWKDDELVTARKPVHPLTYPPSSPVLPRNVEEKDLCEKDQWKLLNLV